MRTGVRVDQVLLGSVFTSSAGSRVHTIYTPVLDHGTLSLVDSGHEDIPTLINSYVDQTDMSIIMSRLAAGDASPLYARQAFYGDFSGCSHDHAEMLRTVMDARAYFDHLSDGVRAKFHDSFVEWFSTAGSPEWASSMSPASPAAPAPEPVGVVDHSAAVEVSNSVEGG